MRVRRWEHVYDAVACGMWLYVHRAFQIVLLGGEHLRMQTGPLVVATHRSDSDVPLICAELYFGDRMWKRHHLRIHFAARDDLFERGVLAGLLPPTVPRPVTRALYAIDPSDYLAPIRINPIRPATTARAVQAVRADPSRPLGDALPADLVERIVERAAAAGLPEPLIAGDADRPELADLLWTEVEQDELPGVTELWQRRSQDAVADLRRLVEVVRAGEPLLLFPEGRPSPDGTIGPLRKGVGLLVRRGAPKALLPIAIAYDPFTLRRPRACLAVGAPFPPAERDVEEQILAALRRLTPLTCGQVVADRILQAAEANETVLQPAALDAELARAVDEARAEGRPFDTALETRAARQARLTECLESLERRDVARARDPRAIVLTPAVLADTEVRRAATEYASARAAS